MGNIFEKFKNAVEEDSLLNTKEKIIAGVSGGPDSIFLFHMLCMWKKLHNTTLVVAHLNHLLRKESVREEEFVKNLCVKHKVTFVSERKNVLKYYRGDSLEQVARNLRYDFFLKVSRRFKIKKVALAHHKDDLVETILLRIMRGCGLLGLRGILPISKYKKILVIRPLLAFEKSQIIKYLDDKKITYMVDKSNLDDIFLRNKVRHHVIPFLLKSFPSLKDNLYSLAKNVRWDYDFIYGQAKGILEKTIITNKPNLLEIRLERAKQVHKALLNNLLRLSIEMAKGNLRKINSRHIDEVIDLIFNRPPNSIVDIPGVSVIKKKELLVFKSSVSG